MKYIKIYESKWRFIPPRDFDDKVKAGLNLIKDIKLDIEDILIDFLEDSLISCKLVESVVDYSIKAQIRIDILYLLIAPADNRPNYEHTNIDEDMLNDLHKLNSFILNEIGFRYFQSYCCIDGVVKDIFEPGVSKFRWFQLRYKKVNTDNNI